MMGGKISLATKTLEKALKGGSLRASIKIM